jgi:hypothetical protein
MTSPLPAHLAEAIRGRIAVLREMRPLYELPSQPRLTGHPMVRERREPRRPRGSAPTFPDRRNNEVESTS